MSRAYSLRVEGKDYVVEILELGGNKFKVKVGDRELIVELLPTITRPSTPIAPVSRPPEVPEVKEVVREEVKAPQPLGNVEVVTSPVPGKVVRVIANVGDVVDERTAILILESMKMELEIYATCPGKLKEVKVGPGDSVNVGDILAVIERPR